LKDSSVLIDMSEIQDKTNVYSVISKVISPAEFNNIRAVSLACIILEDLTYLASLPNLTLLNLKQA
jgi:hypothetical protein